MTQVKTVVDTTNIPLLMEDNAANPYNKNKPWHKNSAPVQKESADSLFYPENHDSTVDKDESDTIEADKNEKEALEKRWKNLKKRHDTATVEWKQTVANLQKEIDTLKANPSIPQTVEDLEKLKQEDPVLYSKVETIARQIVQTNTSEVKNQLDDINKREYELAKKEAKKELLKAHPDVYSIVETEEFSAWAEQQPKEIRDWVFSNPTNSSLAIRAIDLFKADYAATNGPKPATKNIPDDDASSLISTRVTQTPADSTKKIWTKAEIQRLSMDDYDKLEAEIDQAIREGRVK